MVSELLDIPNRLQPEIPRVALTLALTAATAIGYRILSRSISRVGERLELDAHAQNALRLILRITTLLVFTTTLLTIYELPTTWFIGGSALLGAIVGFGSSQTINNIAAGFYVILSRPFKVKDYVRIGDAEGQVEEISINYTKLYTPTFNLLLIPNTQVMNSRILNLTHEGLIKYTFTLGFPRDLPSREILERCIEPAIEEFCLKHGDEGLRRPEAYFEGATGGAQSFKIRIFVPKGEARLLYTLQSELAGMITNRWDLGRMR